MAVALGTGSFTGSAGNGPVSSFTFSYTCNTGSDRLLMIQFQSTGTISSVTFNGAGLTNAGTGGGMTMWRRVAPFAGAANVQVFLTLYSQTMYSASDWTGADQTTPLGTQVSATGSSSSAATASVTCPTDGAIFGGCGSTAYSSAPGTITAGSGTTLLGWGRSGANGHTKAGGYRLNTGTLSWSLSASMSWGAQAFPINAAGGATFTAKLPELHLQAVRRSVL